MFDADYPHGTRARYNSQRCRCSDCRHANTAYEKSRQRDPRVDAAPIVAHIETLNRQQIGLRSIEDVTGVDRNRLKRIIEGAKPRRSEANKILAVDSSVIADGALVDSKPTRRLLADLIREGYPKTRIAAHLGHVAKVPALQHDRPRVLAKTALKVRKLHALLLAEGDDLPVATTKDRILATLARLGDATAEELFDAMDLDDRVAETQALHRLWKSGAVARTGKPYRYSVVRAQMEAA